MPLKNLRLNYYRNYTNLNYTCSPHLNIFLGSNAQGKSNLLEAIYYLSFGRSYRFSPDEQIPQWNTPYFIIQASIYDQDHQNEQFSLEVFYHKEKKKKLIKVNNKKIQSLQKLKKIFSVVLFCPDDLQLIKGTPGVRRQYLNLILSYLYPDYAETNQRYKRILFQRNHLIKMIKLGSNKNLLEVYDKELSRQGAHILAYRFFFLSRLSEYLKYFYHKITNTNQELSLHYSSSTTLPILKNKDNLHNYVIENSAALEKTLFNTLCKLRDMDIEKNTTSVGPHRDDLIFRIGGVNLREYGSQGQQRSLGLALRLSELQIIDNYNLKKSVLLLDDVFSELDKDHCNSLIQLLQLNKRQVFLTTTSLNHVPEDLLNKVVIHSVSEGTII